ncbi:MAG: PD40 domain-containing protein [Marinilabiliaceae bacterium]|nr:PD40 domain-containing protein [Marinilabiliaceae bacterium]
MKQTLTILFLILVLGINVVDAQYFGQNKPSYEQFDFELYKTPHFEIYHYFDNPELVNQLASLAEKWYYYHQQVLIDTFDTRNPLIFYSNHGDFQQTNTIHSRIEVGTGGVTEGLKRRVVMPVTFSHHQTDHVLGHELVHAFQYHILTKDEAISLAAINNIPLWMIEGMAEFLSLGSVNSQTALWMRDALIHDRFPTLKQMTMSYRYSPYRYGHAFWAFISYKYGEQYIPRLFKAAAVSGYEQAIGDVLMLSTDSLSVLWKETLESHMLQTVNDSTFSIIGKTLISKENGGRYNLNPSLSPDGKYIVFLSERDLYDIDLFMAKTQSGKVISRIYTATSHDEIDALNFIETSGSWSPDSRYFAFIAYKKGQSTCFVFDVKKKDIIREVKIRDVDEISWPAWSPDGESIAFAGLKNGRSDIYVYNRHSHTVENLTQNSHSCMQPSWTPDSKSIVYVTDQAVVTQNQPTNVYCNIGIIHTKTKISSVLRTFDNAKNLNPIVPQSGDKILFLSDQDGRRNLYAIDLSSNDLFRITDYPTGIIGMTEYSPALSIAGDTLCYSMLWDGQFKIYQTTLSYIKLNIQPVYHHHFQPSASRLVPYSSIPSQVETNLYFDRRPSQMQVDSFYTDQIEPKFKLDYLGNASAGVMTGRFGTGMAGSVEAMFSDILGQNVLYTAISINGEIYDFGAQVAYINKKNRIKFGAGISHIPYRSGSYSYEQDTLPDGEVLKTLNYTFRRTFEDKVSLFTFLPVNKTRRLELGVAYAFYNYRIEKIKDINNYSNIYSGEKEKLPAPPGFGTAIIDAAFVIDNAKMGLASPVEGKRLRIQMEKYLHNMEMHTFLIDYRRYFFIKPYSLAFRIYHYGRYGSDSDSNRMNELFLGSPWFIRGYDLGDFYGDETVDPSTISINQLIGSRMLVTNMELRIPFTGPKEIAWFRSRFLFSEMAFFLDGGLSWNKNSYPTWSLTTNSPRVRIPVFSAGLAYRVNLFGAMVIEPFYAFPIHQKRIKSGEFGINIFAGW